MFGEKTRANLLAKSNYELKKKFKINVSNVSIKSFTLTKQFLRKQKAVETKKAKEVTSVEVTFSIPQDENVKQGTYVFDIIIKGVGGSKGIAKSLIIDFNGIEVGAKMVFNDTIDWQVGYHKVDIICEEKVLFTGALNLE